MKILLVSLCFFKVPPEKGGGVDNHTYNLANALAKLGHEIHYVANVSNEAMFHKNVVLHPTEHASLPLRTSFLGWVRNHFVANVFAFKSALSVLVHESLDFDVIHSHGNLSSLIITIFKRNIPLVYTVHNPTPWLCHYDSAYERLVRGSVHKVIDVPTWQRCDHIIAPTKAIKSEITRWGILAKKTTVISYCVDTDFFRPDAKAYVHEKFDVKHPYCLFVGQLFRRKGVHYLLRALTHTSIHCVIVGDGPERDSLTLLAKKLGISSRVIFTGAIPSMSQNLRRLYSQAEFFILPSTSEALPIVLLEAMSSGLPVIATNIPGMADVVLEGYNGFLVPPQDEEVLGSKINVLAENAQLRKYMGSNARRMIENEYSWRSIAEKTIKVYEKVKNYVI